MKVTKLIVMGFIALSIASCGGKVNVKRTSTNSDNSTAPSNKQSQVVKVDGKSATIYYGCDNEPASIQCARKNAQCGANEIYCSSQDQYKTFYNDCSRKEEPSFVFAYEGECNNSFNQHTF